MTSFCKRDKKEKIYLRKSLDKKENEHINMHRPDFLAFH